MQNKQQKSEMEIVAMQVSWVSITVNIVLSLGKLVAGVLGHSGAMISDAIHSASDVFSTFIVMIGIRISAKHADDEHPYGHERLECVASILLAVVLLLTGCGIGWEGIQKILHADTIEIAVPTMMPLVAAVASIALKEWMYHFTKRAAKKVNSSVLMADAWHHRSDALSSIGAFVGILGARLGFPILDPIASLVICGFIAMAAWEIFQDALSKIVDESCDSNTQDDIRRAAMQVKGVECIDLLRTRQFGARAYVEIEICADGSLSLRHAHEIAEQVHHGIEQAVPMVKHCTVHVNPTEICHLHL